MKNTTIALAAAAVASIALGADRRTLELTRPADAVQTVEIQAGVGDVDVSSGPGDTVSIHVEVRPKGAHFWSSNRTDLDALEVAAETRGSTLVLRISPERRHDLEIGEDWTVRLPARLGLRVKLGVGDVHVLDMTGDMKAEVGVGDVKIEGSYDAFGDVHASCGVGDATLRTPAGRSEGEGFIGHSLRASGPGKADIEVSAGVGDVTIRLR
ncbi:MAG TPA: hypothetical protein VLW17_12905 [Thermoanaerobaculaceae bacterium]|nr:hypothetical protein [Thermoanaerobaculaceae bacterium]